VSKIKKKIKKIQSAVLAADQICASNSFVVKTWPSIFHSILKFITQALASKVIPMQETDAV
jgi:hypothetical protein